MIRDTCTCGATFTSNHAASTSERNDHTRWLAAHAVCRERMADRMEMSLLARDETPVEDE